MKIYPVSIVIPVYKNYEMFFNYLKINKDFFSGCEVIIMNDYPGSKIKASINEFYPEAKVFDNDINLGFAGNVNMGVKKATRNYILLLNSDVILKNNNFLESLKFFKERERLFAIGFAQEEKNGKIVGANQGYFYKGFINHQSRAYRKDQLSTNFWAEGGSSIFDRNLFIKLGMLDETFNPFYWEDIDLSYRALKSGYEVLFDPNTVVEHHHESTIGKYFDKKKIETTAFRNQLFFQWKNITDPDLVLKHITSLFWLFFISIFKRNSIFIAGFFQALTKLPKVLASRKKTVKLFIRKDKEIIK